MGALAASFVGLVTKVLAAFVAEVKASTTVYGYSFVMRDSDGKIVPLSTAAGTFEGIFGNSTVLGTDTERKALVQPSGLIRLTISSIAITDIGKPVFCHTDNPADVSLTQAAGAKRIGRVAELEYSSAGAVANTCYVELEGRPLYTPNIEHLTDARTVAFGENGSTFTNLGASGAVTVALPQVAPKGMKLHFCVMAAQELRIAPGAAGAIYINGAKQADNKYISADDEGEHVTLTADGNGDWIAGPYNGTFTVEA